MTDPSPLTHVVAGCNKQVLHELRAATLYALHCVLHLKLILRSFPPPLPSQDFVSLVRASFRRVSAGPVRLPQQQQQLNHVCNPHVDSVSLQVQVLWCSTSQQARAATHWQRLCSKVRAMAARTRARDVAGLTVPPLAGLLARATVERIVNVKWNAGEYISNSVFVVILLTPFSIAACVPFIVAIFRSPQPPPYSVYDYILAEDLKLLEFFKCLHDVLQICKQVLPVGVRLLSQSTPNPTSAEGRRFRRGRAIAGASSFNFFPPKPCIIFSRSYI